MVIHFDEQDLRDAVCVATGLNHADGRITYSRPHDVTAEVIHHHSHGFYAYGDIDDIRYEYNEQQLTDAVAVYMHKYYSFNPEQLAVNFNRSPLGELSAQVAVLR